uniref:Lon proteolytic domain-containing protein n=1 Tax=Ignisphaera aggregans TaxID=334771 RepID=A0A7J2U6E9_9CREN
MPRIAMILLLLILTVVFESSIAASQYYTLDESRHVTIVAVTQLPNGSYTGVTAELYVRVACPGNGHVYVETFPLAEIDLQASTRVAAIVASTVANMSFGGCDFYASIRSDSPIVGGPSASGVTAVAFASALLRLSLNESIMMTGMIMPDGSIGPVGGVYYKLQAVISRGAKVFLVPYGQTTDTIFTTVAQRVGPLTVYRTVSQTVDLVSYGASHGVVVKPVANIYEALNVFTNGLFSYSTGGYEEAITRIYNSIAPMLRSGIDDMRNEINNVVNLSRSVEQRALSTSYAQYLRQILSNIDNNINNYMALGSKLETQNQLYSAASMYFQALIYAYWRLHLLNAATNSNYISTTANTIKSDVYSLLKKVWSLASQPLDTSKLSILINTVDRLYEALIYMNRSVSTRYLDSSTQYLAIASARISTARFWLNLFNLSITPSVMVIRPSDLEELSSSISALAQNIYSYIIAFSSQIPIPQDLFSEAQARYSLMLSTNTSIDKLSLGISSISYMYLTLLYMFMLNESTSLAALNKTIEISLTRLKNSLPIDVPLLLELISGLGTTSTRLYNVARLSMLLSTYVALGVESKPLQSYFTSQSIATPQSISGAVTIMKTITVTTTQQSTYTVTVTSSVTARGVQLDLRILILLIFIILVLVILLKLVKI